MQREVKRRRLSRRVALKRTRELEQILMRMPAREMVII